MKSLRVGTRKSQLALTQTKTVVEVLRALLPRDCLIDVVAMSTTGDQILDSPLHEIGSKALFTKELETALLNGSVDIVVHSLKDVPTQMPDDNLILGAVLDRQLPNDVVVGRPDCRGLRNLAAGSVVGTSSVRRIAQLKRLYPHLHFQDIRGNLNTRLAKLDGGDYDALILAYAGVHRLGWTDRIVEVLPCHESELGIDGYGDQLCYYAVGQGTLAIECRRDDVDTRELLRQINDLDTECIVTAERALMTALEGGCSIPIGVSCRWTDPVSAASSAALTSGKLLQLHTIVCSRNGNRYLEIRRELEVTDAKQAAELGRQVAADLLASGARQLLND